MDHRRHPDGRPGERVIGGKRLLVVLAAVLAVLVPGAPAWAHNALAEATPQADATLKAAPKSVKLRFLQRLNPDRTTVAVSDDAKRELPADQPVIDGATVTLTLTAPPANGAYTVAYSTVSLDGHAVKGTYRFTVRDPTATVSASPSPPAATAEAAAPVPVPAAAEKDDNGPVLIAVAATGAALLALGGLLWWRRRRT
jgi:LPXTG-motif cell wall-anchored protein